MKAVLDTNVFISALFWQGPSSQIFQLAQTGKITICVSREILEEYERTLSYKKFQQKLASVGKTQVELIDEFLEVAEQYFPYKFSAVQVKNDPTDDKFLACALSANANYIISGDKHLLQLENFYNIPILTPQQFLRKITSNK